MFFWFLLAACGAPEPATAAFVRGGVLQVGGDAGVPVGGGRRLVARAWRPGEQLGGVTAPRLPECVALWHVDLGDVARSVALGGPQPDSSVAFSPDGAWLAVGSALGDVLVINAFTGAERARLRRPEAMVKAVAWSPDGRTVYAGEQSRDAFLLALDAATLHERWRVRLADRIGTSEVPATDDMYAAYTLPGVYGLDVLPDGGVLVSAVHAWGLSDDERQNASQIVLLGDDGEERGVWPQRPVSATFLHPRVSGDRVAVQVGRSASGPAPVLASGPLPVGGVQVLRLPTLEPATRFTLSPLAPYYTSVFLWDATAVVGDRLVVGTTDGRVVGVDAEGLVDWQRDLGTPIVQGDVPVAAPVGNAVAVASGVAAVVGGSNVPYGATTSAATPPSPHLQANSLHVLDPVTGRTAWTWRGHVGLGGVSASPDGALLAVGTADGGEQDWRGALLFRADGAGSGDERLLARCPTEGRVFFRHDVSLDGRVAVVEVPWRDGDRVAGAYRVTVLR